MASEKKGEKLTNPRRNKDGTLAEPSSGPAGGSSNPSGRFPRLLDQDLKLGLSDASLPSSSFASGASTKKMFSPNLGSKVRKEATAPFASSEKREKKKWEPRTDRGRGRGNRGRGAYVNPNHMQTESIFELGPTAQQPKNAQRAPTYGGGAPQAGEAHLDPVSLPKNANDPEKAKKLLERLFKDDFVADTKSELQSLTTPVQLPLYMSGKMFKSETKSVIKEPNTQQTKFENGQVDSPEKKPELAFDTRTSRKRQFSCSEVFGGDSNEEGHMIFFQLPDSLPFDLAPAGEMPEKATTQTNDQTTETVTERADNDTDDDLDGVGGAPTEAPNACTLQKLPRGEIGKIRIRKSGKCEMVFHNGHVLDLSMGTPSGFLQEFVSVKLDEENRTGDMYSLGHLKHKVIAVPNFETLVKNSNS